MVTELPCDLFSRFVRKIDPRKRLHECSRKTTVSSSIAYAPSKHPYVFLGCCDSVPILFGRVLDDTDEWPR